MHTNVYNSREPSVSTLLLLIFFSLSRPSHTACQIQGGDDLSVRLLAGDQHVLETFKLILILENFICSLS